VLLIIINNELTLLAFLKTKHLAKVIPMVNQQLWHQIDNISKLLIVVFRQCIK